MNVKPQTAIVLLAALLTGVLVLPPVVSKVSAEETATTATNEGTVKTPSEEAATEETSQSTSTVELEEEAAETETSTTDFTASSESATTATTTTADSVGSATTSESTSSTSSQKQTVSSSSTAAYTPTKAEQAAMKDHLASQATEDEVTEHYQFSVSKNQTTQEFIASIQQSAQEVAWANDLYASVMVAQAILETGSGNSQLSQAPYYNLFGIKGQYKGKGVTFATQEDNGSGSLYTIQDEFRQYPGFKESLEDYAILLTGGLSGNSSFYQYTWKSKTDSYKDATAFLTGRYATDTQYGAKLNALIEAYELTALDGEPTKSSESTPDSGTKTVEASESQSAAASEAENMKVPPSEATVGGVTANGTAVEASPAILTVPVQDIELWQIYDK